VSSLSRRAALAATVLAAVPTIAACGAGHSAIMIRPYAPADGVQADSGDGSLRVLNALVVGSESGDAVVSLTISDRGGSGDELVGMTSGEAQISFEGSAEVPPRGTLTLGPGKTPGGAKGEAVIVGGEIEPGDIVPLTLSFAKAGTVTLRTVATPAEGYYEAYTVPPPATTAPNAPAVPGSPTVAPKGGQVDVEATPAPETT
jgi:hypothetical protein